MVEGVVHEVQYALPTLDKRFIEAEMKNPTGYVADSDLIKLRIRKKQLDASMLLLQGSW